MKSFRDTCLEFFKNEDIKRDVKEVVRPIFTMIYNEVYVYIWLICIYHVFFILIILANVYLLANLIKKQNIYTSSIFPTFVLQHHTPIDM